MTALPFDELHMPMSSAAIERRSGKPWLAWFALLDAWGATTKSHTEIAAYLITDHGVDDWNAQSITLGYERARGMRPVHGNRDGTFDVSVSKTFPVSAAALFEAFVEDGVRDRWLGQGTLTLRTSSHLKSARFDQPGQCDIVAMYFVSKGDVKASVQVQEEELSSKDAVTERRAVWKDRLADLAAFLARETPG